ncbi:hypothetical protein B7L88_gp123 [Rhizobium phage RHEph10]|uniref:hypothetical protein n=1 Tax=Rhizobium phage RHEph10 TaxID=1220717 RepID=UPI0002AB136B|nr:hypothetical protein B7L88_gp123 [Rhizobium phage RHEph10]AGC36165.1 hypothetical protein RHEph10_gp122 [Rhizobium phage RHEph10]
METSDIWKKVKIDPELAKHVVLSPADVLHLAELAACAENPAEWLSTELTNRGQQRKNQVEARKIQRMKEDAARLRNFGAWPAIPVLALKTQPWVTEAAGTMRFATITRMTIERGAPILVVVDDGPNETFDSVEDLVKVWSVD